MLLQPKTYLVTSEKFGDFFFVFFFCVVVASIRCADGDGWSEAKADSRRSLAIALGVECICQERAENFGAGRRGRAERSILVCLFGLSERKIITSFRINEFRINIKLSSARTGS